MWGGGQRMGASQKDDCAIVSRRGLESTHIGRESRDGCGMDVERERKQAEERDEGDEGEACEGGHLSETLVRVRLGEWKRLRVVEGACVDLRAKGSENAKGGLKWKEMGDRAVRASQTRKSVVG